MKEKTRFIDDEMRGGAWGGIGEKGTVRLISNLSIDINYKMCNTSIIIAIITMLIVKL